MSTTLRTFSLSERVQPEEAKQDGIQLELGDWYIQGIGNSIGAFVDFLGPRPSDDNVNAWANIITSGFSTDELAPEFFGWIFNRPAGNFDEHTEMDLRAGGSGSTPRPGAPLAKGKLRFTGRKPQGETYSDTTRRQLRLTMFINPTRYLRHQPVPRNVVDNPNTWNLGEANLRTLQMPRRRTVTTEDPEADIETSLDGNDNVLIGRRQLCFARPQAWPLHLRRYLAAIEEALDTEFRRARDQAALELESGPHAYTRAPYYALKKVETYFEFSSRNPTQVLRRLQPILESIGRDYKSREYPNGLISSGAEQTNARSVIIAIGSGRQLRVYAKTTHRLRFEVIHDTTKASVYRLLNAAGGGYTTQSRQELLGWFRFLAIDAATQLNNVLSILQTHSQTVAEAADTYEFYGKVFSVVRNARRARDLISLLVENGCIRVGRRGTEFLPEIQQLRRQGVLENVQGADRVAPLYRAALDKLRADAGLPSLFLDANF